MSSDCQGNISFGVCIPSLECQHIMKIPAEHRCEFSLENEDCNDDDASIKYMQFLACNFDDHHYDMYYGVGLLIILMIGYFLCLSVVSDAFTPSLCYISNVLGLSEPLAGATLLALGNSAPDLITCMVGAMKIGFEQIIAQVLGGGMFLTTVVVASITLIRPFRQLPTFFYRNLVTYIVAILLLETVYEDGIVHIGEAILFLVLYAGYLGLYFIHAKFYRKKAERFIDTVMKHDEAQMEAHDVVLVVKTPELLSPRVASVVETGRRFGGTRLSSVALTFPRGLQGVSFVSVSSKRALEVDRLNRRRRSSYALEAANDLSERIGLEMPAPLLPRQNRTASFTGIPNAALQVERTRTLRMYGTEDAALTEAMLHGVVMGVVVDGETMVLKSTNLWEDFVCHMNPLNVSDWKQSNCFMKLMSVLFIPTMVLCKLFIPCVDESVVCNNWCKLLTMLQCLYLPPMICCLLGVLSTTWVLYVPVLGAVTMLGVAVSLFVLFTTEVNKAPRYHMLCGIMGFFISMLAVYYVANEVVSLLHTIGQVLGISIATLSMTLLPWGNSVGDLVNAMTLSRAGYPRMAYTAVYGSNLLMVLMGVGFSFILMVTGRGTGMVYYGSKNYHGPIANLYFFLNANCLASLMIVPMLNYELRAPYGAFLLVLYTMFFLFCYLSEFSIIHSLAI